MPPTVRNDDVGHQSLEIVLPFQGLVTAPVATQDYPFPVTDAYASDGNNQNIRPGFVKMVRWRLRQWRDLSVQNKSVE